MLPFTFTAGLSCVVASTINPFSTNCIWTFKVPFFISPPSFPPPPSGPRQVGSDGYEPILNFGFLPPMSVTCSLIIASTDAKNTL